MNAATATVTDLPDYNMRQAAARLNVHVSTLYNMLSRGDLRTYQVGGKARRVPREEIERIRCGESLTAPVSFS